MSFKQTLLLSLVILVIFLAAKNSKASEKLSDSYEELGKVMFKKSPTVWFITEEETEVVPAVEVKRKFETRKKIKKLFRRNK